MKTYEKPRLMVLSFTASDAICTGCVAKTRGTQLGGILEGLVLSVNPGWANGDNSLDGSEASHLFDEASCDVPCYDYCKNTPEGNNILTS